MYFEGYFIAFINICIFNAAFAAEGYATENSDGRVSRAENNLVQDVFANSIFSSKDQSNSGKFQLKPVVSASQLIEKLNKPEVARMVTHSSILPDVHCLEVVSECQDNIYYVAFADGTAQLQLGLDLKDKPMYYWDSVGWYRLDANRPRAQYCSHSTQIALYVDISDDRIQLPRSEVYWSSESGNHTGKWCVHPTQIFHYRYFWTSELDKSQNNGYFTDLDTGILFDTCDQRQGVFMEFYEYPVTGFFSQNQLRILRC